MSFFDQLPLLNSTSFIKSTVVLRRYNTQENNIDIITNICALFFQRKLLFGKLLTSQSCMPQGFKTLYSLQINLLSRCLKKIPNFTQKLSIQTTVIENNELVRIFKIVHGMMSAFKEEWNSEI